jgi:hypothetical protein
LIREVEAAEEEVEEEEEEQQQQQLQPRTFFCSEKKPTYR